MPFTFLAHQAVVLPLKRARPAWFDGTALVIGSLVPDFEYAWQELPKSDFAHSFRGVLAFSLPVGLVITWLVKRVVARPLARHLPDGPRLRMRDYAALERAPGGVVAGLRTAVSVVLGAVTHVVWDAGTHGGTFLTSGVPWLEDPLVMVGDLPLRPTGVLQLVSSVGGVALTLALLHGIARKRSILAWAGLSVSDPEVARAPLATPASRRALWTPVVVFSLLGALWGGSGIVAPTVATLLGLCVRALFRTVAVGFAGLVVGCVLARRRD